MWTVIEVQATLVTSIRTPLWGTTTDEPGNCGDQYDWLSSNTGLAAAPRMSLGGC
jgi:hypothetical protein